jgi:protein SCO1/2
MAPRVRLALFVTGILSVAAIAAVLAFAAGNHAASTISTEFAGSVRPPGIPPTPFRLDDERGKPVRLRAMRGTPVVVTFLYTTCRDTCPLTTDQIRGALDELGHDVPVIAVSVDPANDTAARAKHFTFVHRMTGRMRWVLGDAARLQRIWRAYGVQPQGNGVEHSASTVVLDATGHQRVGFPTDQLTSAALAHDIAALERESTARANE